MGDAFRILYMHARDRLPRHAIYVVMAVAGGDRLHLADQARARRRGERQRRSAQPHRVALADGRDLGQADVGHVLAMGRRASHVLASLQLFLYLGYWRCRRRSRTATRPTA